MDFQKYILKIPRSMLWFSAASLLAGTLLLVFSLLFYYPVKPVYYESSLEQIKKENTVVGARLTIYDDAAQPALNTRYYFEPLLTDGRNKRLTLVLKNAVKKQDGSLEGEVCFAKSPADSLLQTMQSCKGKLIILEKAGENLLHSLIR